MSPSKPSSTSSASRQIDALIAGLTDWRGATFTRLREIVRAADPDIVEEWKWMGSPLWSCDGMIAVGNAHKGKVKLTFAYGASLPDPAGLFNAGLDGNARRAIDVFEGNSIDADALAALVHAAIAHNRAKLKKNTAKRSTGRKVPS